MKQYKFTLPVKVKGSSVQLGYSGRNFYFGYQGKVIVFVLNKRLMIIVSVLLGVIVLQSFFYPQPTSNTTHITENSYVNEMEDPYKDDVVGFALDHMDELDNFLKTVNTANTRERFTVQKQLLVSKYLIKNKASRLDQLDDQTLLELNKKISSLFVETVFQTIKVEKHVFKYFTDTVDLKKFETALMEQIKYNVPASIKLAQSALETAYGRKVVNNNYFGIKDKTRKTQKKITTEYYTWNEYQRNKSKVVAKKKIYKDGKLLYKCLIKDHFASYGTPWESFRAHSVFLNTNNRYSPLFVNGRNYKAWADKIGSTKYGGVGYATSPIYGQLLKKIIQRYHLDLLDY
ncbi:glucosaminidase domain-containing protein [Rapidithrix thailandica]|uniref:Glucosaminidase domain-containing protein n=1 Tax=Rapidithrix thailandica TaxID=413964 RepID=A0AAW9RQ37_9BACT